MLYNINMIEKEYKFLVNKLPNDVNFQKYSIEQTYINLEDAKDYFLTLVNLSNERVDTIDTARIRKLTTQNETKYFLCGKSKGLGSRQE